MISYLKCPLIVMLLMCGSLAQGKLKVVSTTPTLTDLIQQIGGTQVEVRSIAKGTQDPHYIEAKPSYMLLLRDADLLVSVGLGLEQGWLPNVMRGARSPRILQSARQLALGEHIEAIDKPQGAIDRAEGDMHAEGNPHFYLDPVRVKKLIPLIADRMTRLDPENKDYYQKQAAVFEQKLGEHLKKWEAQLSGFKSEKVITYHKTLSYFLKRFELKVLDSIEPKPGIAPSAKHTLGLIAKAKEEKAKCILNESFFETTAARRISEEINGKFKVVPTEVGATKEATDYIALINNLVNQTAQCLEN